MTGPVTTEALREALLHACFDPGSVVGPRGGLTTDEWRADACMKQLAPLLAAHQQVTAERDEARDKQRDMHRRAQKAESFRERHRGGVRYSLSRRWEDRQARRRAEASLATATSELARLRAEGEAEDRALKAKAEEQVAYWRKRQQAEKCLEDGASEDGLTYTPIGDVAAWQGGYCNGRMSEADWWLKTLLHWPNEAASAATAREGQAEQAEAPKADAPWPAGCIKPNSCARHRQCMYGLMTDSCRHRGRDISEEVAWAEAEKR